jgi:hypothetical protein
MDFDQTWYILSPWESLEPYWFSRSKVKSQCHQVKFLPLVTLTFDLWPWKSIGFQTLPRTKYVPSLVKIHWRMLILECSQGCYAVNNLTPCEHSRINILQRILTKLGTYLVLKKIWNPIDFQDQRSKSPGQIVWKIYSIEKEASGWILWKMNHKIPTSCTFH